MEVKRKNSDDMFRRMKYTYHLFPGATGDTNIMTYDTLLK